MNADAWEGDFDELPRWDERLTDDGALCERMFSSKHEAYLAGRSVSLHHKDSAPGREGT